MTVFCAMAALQIFELFMLTFVSTMFCETAATMSSCVFLKEFLKLRGLDGSLVPSKPRTDTVLRICFDGKAHVKTCCTSAIEERLMLLSQDDFKNVLARKIEPTKRLLGQKGTNDVEESVNIFTAHFQNITAAKELSRVDYYRYFFLTLWQYLYGRKHNLAKKTKLFFRGLKSRTILLLEPHLNHYSQWDRDRYVFCVMKKVMRGLRIPFGDIARKFMQNVVRVFQAARVFEQGMSVGYDLLVTLLKIMKNKTRQCQVNLTKTNYCSLCLNYQAFKPCKEICHNSMRGCFHQLYSFIDPLWKDYITALVRLVEALEGRFGFVAVLNDVNRVILEAQKTMTDKYHKKLKDQIPQHCQFTREHVKRSIVPVDRFYFDERTKGETKDSARSTTTNLKRLLTTFKDQIKASKDMWNRMVDSVCSELSATGGQCWDGTNVIKTSPDTTTERRFYDVHRAASGRGNQSQIPEAARVLAMKLKNVTMSMKLANFKSDEEDEENDNGNSGSGNSDSGVTTDLPFTEPTTVHRSSLNKGSDEDDEENDNGNSGSGNSDSGVTTDLPFTEPTTVHRSSLNKGSMEQTTTKTTSKQTEYPVDYRARNFSFLLHPSCCLIVISLLFSFHLSSPSTRKIT